MMVLLYVLPPFSSRQFAEDLVGRMDLDHVDATVHSREAIVPLAVAVAVAEHPAHIGMIDLDQLVASHPSQRANRSI